MEYIKKNRGAECQQNSFVQGNFEVESCSIITFYRNNQIKGKINYKQNREEKWKRTRNVPEQKRDGSMEYEGMVHDFTSIHIVIREHEQNSSSQQNIMICKDDTLK